MGYRSKQNVLSWGISNGWETSEEVLHILSHQGNANQNNPEIPPHTPVRLAKIQISDDSRCWRSCGERGTLLHCWWCCKLIQPLWKSVWQFFRTLDIVLPEDPAIQLMGLYPTYNKDTCSTMFIAALFIISRRWKEARCPPTEECIQKMYIYTTEYCSAI